MHGLCTFLYVLLYVPIRSGRPPLISIYGRLASGVPGKPSRHKGSSYTIHVLCNPHATPCELLYVPIRSVYALYTFPMEGTANYQKLYVPKRSALPLPQFLQSVLRGCTFLYVPITFLYVLSKLCCKCFHKVYVPMRSAPPLPHLLQNVMRSYTFLYVPITFLYVLSKLCCKCVQKLYVPIRSALPLPHFLQRV